jgi:hypothetical protein
MPSGTILHLSVFASNDLGVTQKRRELRGRSDGCRPPQPSEVSDLIGSPFRLIEEAKPR